MQAPVEHRGRHRDAGAAVAARWWLDEVRERFGDTEEHQADAHTGGEHHRDPADGAELRLLVVLAERDAAVAAHRQPEREEHESARREHEQPTELDDDPVEDVPGNGPEVLGGGQTPHHDRRDQRGSDSEDHFVGLRWARRGRGYFRSTGARLVDLLGPGPITRDIHANKPCKFRAPAERNRRTRENRHISDATCILCAIPQIGRSACTQGGRDEFEDLLVGHPECPHLGDVLVGG